MRTILFQFQYGAIVSSPECKDIKLELYLKIFSKLQL